MTDCCWCKPPPEGQNDAAKCVRAWHLAHRARFGECYIHSDDTDFGRFGRLCKLAGLPAVLETIAFWWAGRGDWCNYDLGTFIRLWNTVRADYLRGSRGPHSQVDESRKALEELGVRE